MTAGVRNWLPPQVAERPSLQAGLATVVSNWSERWFSGAGVGLSRLSVSRSAGSGAEALALGGSGVSLRLVGDGTTRLVALALDMPIERLELTEADQQIVDAVHDDLLADLLQSIQRTLALPDAGPMEPTAEASTAEGGVQLALAEGYGPDMVVLTIPFGDLIPSCLASMPTPRKRSKPLGSISAAIASASTLLRARLGTVRLSLGDLRTLAVGDVLVLDQATNQPLALTNLEGDRILGLRPIRLDAPAAFTACP